MTRRCLLFCMIIAAGFGASSSQGGMLTDFDSIRPKLFQFKDSQGSYFVQDPNALIQGHDGKALRLKYEITPKGWAGWGISLEGLDISGFRNLTFQVSGAKGGEKFELGLKDKSGGEKKVQSSDLFDITDKWQKVTVPLSAFQGVNLKSVESISFGFNDTHGTGSINIDDIALEGDMASPAPQASAEPTSGVSRTNKVLVDGFERANPSDFYMVRTGDDSTLSVASSRLLHDGDYAMSMEYLISTQKPMGSWVLVHWDSRTNNLDWTAVESVKIWLKGDGTDNIMFFSIIDSDGESWTYEDTNILRSTKWSQMTMPVSQFFLSADSKDGNQRLDLDKIKGFEIGVMNKSSIETSGKVYIDQLYVTGAGLSAVWAAPPSVAEKLRAAVSAIGNVDLSGLIYSEYFQTPEESQRMSHWGKLIANAKAGDFSGRIEFATESQNFSDAAYMGTISKTNTTAAVQTQSPKTISPSIQVMGNNLSSRISNVTIGNLWFDYTKYTFSGGWGWKGVAMEGDVERFNYHAFYISQPYDSFAAGTRWIGYFPDLKVTGYAVAANDTARIQNVGNINSGSLANAGKWDIKQIADDIAYCAELLKYFDDKRVQVEATAGWDKYNKYAEADYTDPYHPVYSQKLDSPVSLWDNMYKGRIETNNILLEDLRVAYEYRSIGAEYKPRYRQNPSGFDDSECDQKGYNVRASHRIFGFTVSAEYDDIKRISDSAFYRFRSNYGVGYYGYYGIDVSVFVESKREQYTAASSRSSFSASNRNDKVGTTELYIRNQLSPLSSLWFKIRVEDIDDTVGSLTYQTHSFYTKYEYYLTSNAKLFAEYKTTRYPQSSWEPNGYPFDDNFAKAYFELTF